MDRRSFLLFNFKIQTESILQKALLIIFASKLLLMSKKFVHDFLVKDNIQLNSSNFLINLQSKEELRELLPGQFVNVEIKNSKEIFLRRPFSVFDVDYENNTISLIVKILGRGSKTLTEIKTGDILNIIFPLGKNFTKPEQKDKILLVGGGSGLAPMLFQAKVSGLKKENVDIIIGARTKEDHISVDNYLEFANIHFTTVDGSQGEKGFVTQHSIFTKWLRTYDKVYACGPDGMMRAVAKEANKLNIFCEVSLENLMACGFGVCLCCIEPTVKGNLCICTEGPVFNIKDLKW